MPSLPLEASAYADSIIALASALTERAHLFVDGLEDVELRAKCEQALKMGFDRALSSEASAFPHLSTFITSLTPPPSSAPSTRSKSRSSDLKKSERSDAQTVLPPTPLLELTTEGMEPEMIWEQIEMRNSVVDELLQEMFGGEEREEEEGDEDEENSDEEAFKGAIEGEDNFDTSAFDRYDRGEGSDEEEGDEEEEEDSDGQGSYEDEEEEEKDSDGQGSYEEEEDDDAESQDTEDELAVERFVEMEPFEADLGRPTPGWPNTYIIRGGEETDHPEQAQEEDADPEADETKELSLENFDRPGRKSKGGTKRTGPASAVDDDFFSLHDFHQQVDEGEAEMDRMIRGEADSDDGDDRMDDFDLFAPVDGANKDEDEEEEEEEEDLDVAGIMYSDFFDPPSRPLGGKKDGKKGGGSGPADDKPKERGKRKANEVKASSITVVTNPIPTSNGDAAARKEMGKGTDRVKFADKVKVKLIPSRGGRFAKLVEALGYDKALVAFEQLRESERGMGLEENDEDDKDEEGSGDDEEMDKDEEGEEGEEKEGQEDEEEEESQLEEQATMQRISSSLFDEDEDDEVEGESKGEKLSRHERRLLQLSSQIASLEAENVGPKKWATLGEAQARNRPANSLLEEDLEFERMGKVVPVITEETTKSIEDLIKKRILDNQFDDVERRRAVDPHAFLPSRFMELQDTKSNKSLAEIYEDDYQSAKAKETGEKVVHEMDAALEAKHQEIEELFDDLAAKLDALSNARFTPKPPKSTISTITNAPTLSLESALPPTQTATSMLAPEEVFVPDPTNEDRSDFTPAQKKAARQKRRKARAAMAEQVERIKESKGAKGAKGAKKDKEVATQMLVGQKGVTVLGKGGKKVEAVNGKKRKRSESGDDDAGGPSGVRLKL